MCSSSVLPTSLESSRHPYQPTPVANPQPPVGQSATPQWVDRPAGDTGLTTETVPRHMKFVRVALTELDDLRASNSTLELAFFGMTFGAFVTILSTLRTVQINDASTHAAFVASAVLLGVLSAYFGIATIRGEARWRKR